MADELIPREIYEVPAAIRATLAETRVAARRAAEAIRARPSRRIYFIGNGTSYYSSLAATYLARSLAAPEDALVLARPAGDFRYFTPALSPYDVIVGISASGEFRDVLAVFERHRGQCLLVGITHVPGSSLARLADVTLLSGGGPSRVPVMTKTYASTLTAAYLLLLEFYGAPDPYVAELAVAADQCTEAITQADRLLPELVPLVAPFEHAFYFGAGSGYAAALEGALKMKEMALLHAEGSETWEMASGPATMVGIHTLCVALYTGGPGDAATVDGAQHARRWGARVVEIGPRPAPVDLHLPAAALGHDAFAPLLLVSVEALLAYRVARARGLTPDTPTWRDRYSSQGMTHIIGAPE
ncbi:MAG: SIS domain-containing protein [Ardenticatenaceae bacterium]|nr:SIS domain-containing protein [Ardenticatenaceae bacterium]